MHVGLHTVRWLRRAQLPASRRGLCCGLILSAVLLSGPLLRAANPPRSEPRNDLAALPVDRSFTNALTLIQRTTPIRETSFASVLPGWQSNLCVRLGIRVDTGTKTFVRILELTTLPVTATNRLPKAAGAHEAKFEVTCDNTSICATARVYRFTSPRHPVRLRVLDPQGRLLQEEHVAVPWRFLTNGLTAPGLLFASATNSSSAPLATNAFQLQVEAAMVQSLAALLALFNDALGADALEELRDHATPIARWPNWFKVLAQFRLDLNLAPHFERSNLHRVVASSATEELVVFPAELTQGKRVLVNLEFLAGSTIGPHFLTAGVRAIRATHPTKPDRQLLARVLAAGLVDESSATALQTP